MASDTISVAALGRPFTLGMLYNAQKDELVPGVTIWEAQTLLKKTSESEHRTSESRVVTSDSIASRSSLLDVDAPLNASLVSGLVEVGGSAKFLKDKKQFLNQSRVTFHHKVTSTFKQLLMSPTEAKNVQQMEDVKGLATHVVTGILYGANAFFVFDSRRLDAGEVQDVQDRMEAVLKKIPSLSAQDNDDISLTYEEEALIDQFTCKFYGDFSLESDPSTFRDAVKTYLKVRKQLNNSLRSWKGGVPLKVWMMPLKKEDSTETAISTGLARAAEDTLEDVWHLEMRCNESLEETAELPFLQLREKLKSFKKLCFYYTAALQQRMRTGVPLIRAGKEKERDLKLLFENRPQSPFGHITLSRWLDNVEREILVIKSCLRIMAGVKTLPNKAALDREVLNPDGGDVFCFAFTSLTRTDPHLKLMADCVDSLHVSNSVFAPLPSVDQWFFSDKVISKLREKAKLCQVLDETYRVFVAAIDNPKYTGATIYHFSNGVLVSDSYSEQK